MENEKRVESYDSCNISGSVVCLDLLYSTRNQGRRSPLLLEEKGRVTDIDLSKQQITVQLESLNSYYDGLKIQPYDSDKVVLNCKWMEKSASTLKEIKLNDEVIYMHYDNKPNRVEKLELLYEEKAVVTGVFLYRNEIKVKLKQNNSICNFYEKEEVSLDCSHVYQGNDVLDSLEIFDEIVFTHVHDDPYTVLELKKL